MCPLELEMFHQMKNVIGVDPSNYEFILMVDADTEVLPDSLNRMVSCMVHDAKIVGLCGETMLANEKESLITMMQVYEYYISHHLAKAFESLFGSVTCLPGCFCMYRIHTPNKSIPLLTSIPVVTDYSVNNVDTLHKKNLLSLGEDRYLTTLMLKHFPKMKLKFTRDAQCRTFAPDRWGVLLSQRRRWINSTIHNLLELLLLPELCGFCCLSMRFVALFDLFATLVMPATLGYLGYLVYNAALKKFFPLVSLILLAAGYGLQIIIFLARGQWQHIGWLAIYILALPVFTFILPAYSFWHMDDFSWGNTRIVIGERGGKKTIIDEEPFDPASIPVKRWSDYAYEEGLWDGEEEEQEVMEQQHVLHYDGSELDDYASSHLSYGFAPLAAHPMMRMSSAYGTPMAMVTPEPGDAIGGDYYNGDGDVADVTDVVAKETTVATTRTTEPTDEQIEGQVRAILATADLTAVTKKQVRAELSLVFGVDMTSRKPFINQVIEQVLSGL